MTEPQLKMVTLLSGDLNTTTALDTTTYYGPFTNKITIRRFVFGTGTPTGTSPVLLLNIDDGGTDGTETTAIADRASAAVTVPGFVLQANNVTGADGYVLDAGNVIKILYDVGGTTPVFPGANLIMEYVDGVG